MITVCRSADFNAAHRLYNKDWSDMKNREIYGKCSNPNFHGHNYRLMVKVTGEIDPETGYVTDLKTLRDLIRREVTDRFDHKNLNLDTEEFKNLNPTAENIAVAIYNLLKPYIKKKELTIILHETERNSVEYTGPGNL